MSEPAIAITVAVIGGLVACGTAFWEYRRSVESSGAAIKHVYISTIQATKKSLINVKKDTFLEDTGASQVALLSIHDFRREDWFAVHHQLCGDLGKLVNHNPVRGPRAVQAVSSFFQDLKYVRELFAYVLAVQRAAMEQSKHGETSEPYDVREHLSHQWTEISRQITQLEEDADLAIDLLKKLKG